MVQSDALSRRSDLCPETDHDNEDRVVLPDDLFMRLVNVELRKDFKESTLTDSLYNEIEAALQLKTLLPICSLLSD